MARSLVKSMLRDGNTDYAQKVMKSVFIANIFKQEDGDIFKEEVGLLEGRHVDRVLAAGCRRRREARRERACGEDQRLGEGDAQRALLHFGAGKEDA